MEAGTALLRSRGAAAGCRFGSDALPGSPLLYVLWLLSQQQPPSEPTGALAAFEGYQPGSSLKPDPDTGAGNSAMLCCICHHETLSSFLSSL